MSESFYDLVEVGANASFEEIEDAYQRIVSYLDTSSLAIYSMMDEEEVTRMRSAVDPAYRTLSDPERRTAYDRALSDGDEYFPVTVPEVHNTANPFSPMRSINGITESSSPTLAPCTHTSGPGGRARTLSPYRSLRRAASSLPRFNRCDMSAGASGVAAAVSRR